MSGLREAFDEIVVDVPVYGDLDRAIEQADRERRHRYGVVAGLAAAAAVVVVVVGMIAANRDSDAIPPVSPSPSPTPTKTQGPETWADTAVSASKGGTGGWGVRDPLDAVRDGWFQIVADHLRPAPQHAGVATSRLFGEAFELPGEDSDFSTGGAIGVMAANRAEGLLADGCAYLHPIAGDHRKESCRTEQIVGPNGEPVHVTSFQSLCTTWDADSAAPGVFYKNCGDYDVTVVAERGDGRIGYVDVQGRDYVEAMPFALADLAAAAADPGLALPDAAYDVPSNQAVASVLEDHVAGFRTDDELASVSERPGYATAWGRRGRLDINVSVSLARGTPTCGRTLLIECVERRVFGADDPTTVYVGAWNFCCPEDFPTLDFPRREFVYVGPRHTVIVSASTRSDEEPNGADLDRTLIDLALDPRLQVS